ncbi:MAG: hypothetical protein PF541_10090, partial [Prolixibacteraceae bacterium]|nr:hypothetical protein [Prolixibacteraceae bacterium]
AEALRKSFNGRILGPEFHLISRMQLYYQLMIRIKLDKNTTPAESKKAIKQAIEKVKNIENNSAVRFIVDVDPF